MPAVSRKNARRVADGNASNASVSNAAAGAANISSTAAPAVEAAGDTTGRPSRPAKTLARTRINQSVAAAAATGGRVGTYRSARSGSASLLPGGPPVASGPSNTVNQSHYPMTMNTTERTEATILALQEDLAEQVRAASFAADVAARVHPRLHACTLNELRGLVKLHGLTLPRLRNAPRDRLVDSLVEKLTASFVPMDVTDPMTMNATETTEATILALQEDLAEQVRAASSAADVAARVHRRLHAYTLGELRGLIKLHGLTLARLRSASRDRMVDSLVQSLTASFMPAPTAAATPVATPSIPNLITTEEQVESSTTSAIGITTPRKVRTAAQQLMREAMRANPGLRSPPLRAKVAALSYQRKKAAGHVTAHKENARRRLCRSQFPPSTPSPLSLSSAPPNGSLSLPLQFYVLIFSITNELWTRGGSPPQEADGPHEKRSTRRFEIRLEVGRDTSVQILPSSQAKRGAPTPDAMLCGWPLLLCQYAQRSERKRYRRRRSICGLGRDGGAIDEADSVRPLLTRLLYLDPTHLIRQVRRASTTNKSTLTAASPPTAPSRTGLGPSDVKRGLVVRCK